MMIFVISYFYTPIFHQIAYKTLMIFKSFTFNLDPAYKKQIKFFLYKHSLLRYLGLLFVMNLIAYLIV